ncbi:MAG: NADH-quinone oxidoreductase subunit N [Bacteroidia bacterium]|nr:NADH-quinone oxidoreductase subunit N [Bacteroidia bacterium]
MNALISLSALGIIAMLSELFNFKRILYPVVLLGLLVAFGLNVMEWGQYKTWYGMMLVDKFALAFSGVIILVGLLWFLLVSEHHYDESHTSDHFAIFLFAMAGAIVLVSFSNLSMLFIGVEILSIAMYIMAASKKSDLASNESGYKYFLMGSFATGFLLFGIALIYGATGTFDLTKITAFVADNKNHLPSIFYAGLLMMLVGLSFKVSAVPFHWWAPDVYTGAPTLVTAFMSTIVKTAAFAAFLRLFYTCFAGVDSFWSQVVVLISAATILLGNITALVQNDFKRILAYSSVAHAGYMLMAILANNSKSGSSMLYYSLAYSISSLAAFGILLAVAKVKGNTQVSSFKGLAKSNPTLAFVTIVAMLSLAGIPATAGFFAKYYVFTAVIANHYTGLALIAILGSLISVFYYLRIIIVMFEGEEGQEIEQGVATKVLLLSCAVLTILFGIMPDWIIGLLS